jgi:hypothetical protein
MQFSSFPSVELESDGLIPALALEVTAASTSSTATTTATSSATTTSSTASTVELLLGSEAKGLLGVEAGAGELVSTLVGL